MVEDLKLGRLVKFHRFARSFITVYSKLVRDLDPDSWHLLLVSSGHMNRREMCSAAEQATIMKINQSFMVLTAVGPRYFVFACMPILQVR